VQPLHEVIFDKVTASSDNEIMILEMLYNWRSTRSFMNRPVEKEKIAALIQAVLLSPTSRNLYPWEFIIIDDRALLTRLSKAKEHGSGFLKGAPLAVVITGDCEKSDVWVEDCSIAASLLQLTAEDLDLGSCWIQIRNRTTKNNTGDSSEAYVRQECGLPEHCAVDSIIALGYPNEEKQPHRQEDLLYNKVHYNRFGKPY